MINFREAKQRLSLHNMHIGRVGASAEYRVSFGELGYKEAEKSAYYTDCLLDAALTGASMRNNRNSTAKRKVA